MAVVVVTVIKNGQPLAQEVVSSPKPGDVTRAIGRATTKARRAVQGPLWPVQIDVREAP